MDTNRFWSQVGKNEGDGCWLWRGSVNEKGYGRLYASSISLEVYAHRISWELHHGKIPEGTHVLHNCPNGDNPSCVNPAHLFLGTPAENMTDKVRKNRQQKGSEIAQSVLDEYGAELLSKDYAAGIAIDALIEKYGICRQTIYNIINGKRWLHASILANGPQRNPRKLTSELAEMIRAEYSAGKASYSTLAMRFGVSKGHVGKVIRGEMWARD